MRILLTGPCMRRRLMDENENLKLEVQGLRSLMLQGMQLPGSSAIPTPALQVLAVNFPCRYSEMQ